MEAFLRSLLSPAVCSQQLLPASCFSRFAGTCKRRSLPTAFCFPPAALRSPPILPFARIRAKPLRPCRNSHIMARAGLVIWLRKIFGCSLAGENCRRENRRMHQAGSRP